MAKETGGDLYILMARKLCKMFLEIIQLGTEPYGKYFAGIGLDAVVALVGSGVTLRMI